jgi:hypothetical protein
MIRAHGDDDPIPDAMPEPTTHNATAMYPMSDKRLAWLAKQKEAKAKSK